MQSHDLLQALERGRTDRVLDADPPLGAAERTRALQFCAYFGDVTALRLLLAQGAALDQLGDDLGLRGAAFHGHWRLCQFLLEQGAEVNAADAQTGETALHAALASTMAAAQGRVVQLLLQAGADVSARTLDGAPTGSLMRDARTRAETPLHRAAAFAEADTLELLLAAGADREARDAGGDTPLAWASWQRRPVEVLRLLLYGEQRIHPDWRPLQENLLGEL
jgi:ankyrin repeat protein